MIFSSDVAGQHPGTTLVALLNYGQVAAELDKAGQRETRSQRATGMDKLSAGAYRIESGQLCGFALVPSRKGGIVPRPEPR
jgi:hypothetical protein